MATDWKGLVKRESDYLFECPKPNCYYRLTGKSEDITEHKCPCIGQTQIGWSMTKSLVEQVWDMLDQTMEVIMEQPDEIPAKLEARAQARAYANVLAIFMVPHFRTVKEIAKEATRRYQAKKGGEEYDTPGLGNLKYMTPPEAATIVEGWYPSKEGAFTSQPLMAGTPRTGKRAVTRRSAATAEDKLGDQEKAAIKFAHESGMFSLADLAKTYGVSEETITKIIS